MPDEEKSLAKAQTLKTYLSMIFPIAIIVILIVITIVAYVEWSRYKKNQDDQWNEAKVQMAQLKENIAVGTAKMPDKKEWKKIVKENIDPAILDYAKKNNMQVSDVVTSIAKINQFVERWKTGDIVKEWTSWDGVEKSYAFKWIWTKPDDKEKQITPAYAMFWTEGPKAGTWTVGTLPFKVKVTTTRLHVEKGKEYTYAVKVVLIGPHNGEKSQRGIEWEPEVEAEDIKISINPEGIDIIKKPKPKFHFWSPHIQADFGGGIVFNPTSVAGSAMVGVGFSPFGYGLTKNDLTWEFLHVGVDYLPQVNSFGFSLAPVSWRPFDTFITNTRWQFIRCGWSPAGYYCGSFLGLDF